MNYKCQFDKIVQLTKSSTKKMSLEVAFETVESQVGVCLSSSGIASSM